MKNESETSASGNNGLQLTRTGDSTKDIGQANCSRPDTSHMLPFKPSTISG